MLYILSANKKILSVRTRQDFISYFINGTKLIYNSETHEKWYGNKFGLLNIVISSWVDRDILYIIYPDFYIYHSGVNREIISGMFMIFSSLFQTYVIDGFIMNIWGIENLRLLKSLIQYEFKCDSDPIFDNGRSRYYDHNGRMTHNLKRIGLCLRVANRLAYYNYFIELFNRLDQKICVKFECYDILDALRISVDGEKTSAAISLESYIGENMTIHHARFYIWIVHKFIGCMFTGYYMMVKEEYLDPESAFLELKPVVDYISSRLPEVKISYIRCLSIIFHLMEYPNKHCIPNGSKRNPHHTVLKRTPPVILNYPRGIRFINLICEEWRKVGDGEDDNILYYDMDRILEYEDNWNKDKSIKTIEELEIKFKKNIDSQWGNDGYDTEEIVQHMAFEIIKNLIY
jgi:hypothetical protein